MNLYMTRFPVGLSAVVVARDRDHALRLLKKELIKDGLGGLSKRITKSIFQRIDAEKGCAVVLQGGNY